MKLLILIIWIYSIMYLFFIKNVSLTKKRIYLVCKKYPVDNDKCYKLTTIKNIKYRHQKINDMLYREKDVRTHFCINNEYPLFLCLVISWTACVLPSYNDTIRYVFIKLFQITQAVIFMDFLKYIKEIIWHRRCFHRWYFSIIVQ